MLYIFYLAGLFRVFVDQVTLIVLMQFNYFSVAWRLDYNEINRYFLLTIVLGWNMGYQVLSFIL